MKKIAIIVTLLLASLLVLGSSGPVRADVVNLPVDTELFFFVFLMIVVIVIALIITIELRRKNERKKPSSTPGSTESEDIAKF
jgi:heme/copper-type cytochrome/quinol oxidase subunit 2